MHNTTNDNTRINLLIQLGNYEPTYQKGADYAKDAAADALIIFSCAGRILSLGSMMNIEIEGLKKSWDVPMAGMFSNAELARATNGNLEMRNLTTCCVVLKEK
ncbi:MAG: FIST C-terminal domain-containing protein [Parafilimonas sp.]